METKGKMLKKLVAVLCAATMVASGTVASVGAVTVAPSHACNSKLVGKVNNLNNKFDGLKNALTSLQQRVNKLADMYIHVKDDYVYVPSDDECFDNIDVLYGRISRLMYIVDRIKGINTARSETYASILSSYLDTVIKEIENNINMSNLEINFYKGTISNNILNYRNKIIELADKLVKDDKTFKPTNNKNKNNNIIKNFNNIDFKNINNNKPKNNSNIKLINNYNNNNNNHNNNIIINNINNNLNNQNWNLNCKDKMNAAVEITKIRDVISVLNNDQNIANNSAFAKSIDFRKTLYDFKGAFLGWNGITYASASTVGLYPIITKRWFKNDVNAKGEYTGKYDVLNRLHKVVRELFDAYAGGNDVLNAHNFKIKIKQKAEEANRLLNEIARLLGEQ